MEPSIHSAGLAQIASATYCQSAVSLTPLRRNRNVARARTTKKSKGLYYGIYIGSYLNYITIMGRKYTSNDADLMQSDQYIIPKNRRAKIPPLEPWAPPDFEVHFAKTLIECTGSNWLVSYCAYITA